jgi:arsenite-transporting ATPase
VNEAFDSLARRRVVLIGGKGGVGKTTVAIAVALRLRDAVLFTTDPASNLADILDERAQDAGDGAQMRPSREQPPAPFRFESVDAPSLYRRFLKKNLPNFLEIGDRGTYLDKEELRRFFELSLPGADELMAWMRIGELAEENPSATIVVDTAPTGHTLRMLGAAQHFRQFAAALDAMQAKHRDLVRQFTRRSVRDAMDAFIAEFETTARRRRELLASSGAFVPVFLSEPWVVEQTRRLIAEVEVPVPFAVLNRVAAPDCERDRARMPRDAAARAALAPLRVVDAPRACVPLDSAERIAQWSR